MAECALSFVGETIGNLFIDEAKFLCGVKGKVKDLRKELERTWELLTEMDERRQHDQAIERWVMELQDIAYAADDVIDQYILRITPEEDENIIKAYADFVSKCTCVRVHAMGTKIEDLKSRISEHRTRMPEHNPAKAPTPIPTYAYFREDFVGKKDDINKLVEALLNGKEQRVISIWGMDGLGKSALAKEVFNHDKVQAHFDGFAWVCLSGEWEVKEILRRILVNLNPDKKEEIREMGEDELPLETYNTQKKKKCIVVLDDIWTNQAWDNLRQAFPLNNMASKLLITTHNRKVAQHVYPQTFLHQPRRLTDDESWELLKMRAFPKTEEISENIKELGGKLRKKCGGLPLAVIELGELLADKKRNMISSTINSLFSNKISEMLAFSYYDLSWHKKQCFLYLCSFPTDEEIPVAKVILMWIAEGFVLPNAHVQEKEETVEDVAKQYLMEFADKGLVQVRRTLSGNIKTCRLCDPVQTFCISKAMQENFLSILNIQHDDEVESSCPTRRLSLHVCGSVEGNTIPKLNQIGSTMLNLRTFMFFLSGGLVKGTWQQFQPIFVKCKFLRVLKLEDLSWMGENLPESVGDLVHLRYLSLARSVIEGLPQSMGNLVCMEFLELPLYDVVVIPDMLWKMRRLRYLHLPIRFAVHGSKKLQLNSLKHLRTLRNFCPEKCDLNVGKQTNLQKLTVCKQYGSDKFKIFPQLVKFTLKDLQSSSFRFSSHSFTKDELSEMSNYPHSCKLSIDGEIEKLPKEEYLPQRLRKLVLLDSQLKEDPMLILEKLPELVVLLLRRAFEGKQMVCNAGGFPQLKHLVLDNLPNLEKWMVFEGAMPHLSRLGIRDCPRLKTPPQGDYTRYNTEDIGHELSKYRDSGRYFPRGRERR